jgi:CheY-like chemotaxis protein
MIATILEPLGFCLYQAQSGAECLEKVLATPPDLILLDLSMPEMDGLETARYLRGQGYTLPIVVLTSNAYPSDRVNAINAGCNDFLAKPLQVPKLLNKLKIQLGLTWIYLGDDGMVKPARARPPDAFSKPPPEVLAVIDSYVKIGDLLGLNQYLADVTETGTEYQDFALYILMLSNEFRLAEIKKFLTVHHEKSTPNKS